MPAVEPALPDPGLRAEIEAAVAEGFDRQLELTREVVRHESVRGREAAVQALIEAQLLERGYEVESWHLDPAELADHPGAGAVDVSYAEAVNVVATHRPTNAQGRSLILNGHVDVVPPGPLAMWRHPPFGAVVEDGWLYGRGAGDMKSGLVAAVAALDALRRLGLTPAATLHLQSVVEEESTGNGTLACHLRGYRAEAALIPEPMGERLVRANLGVLWFRIDISGRPAHVAHAAEGSNAIAAAMRLAQALKDLETLWNGARRLDRWFRDHPHPININIGRIVGGDWASSVSAWCRLDCRAAFYASIEPKDALEEIRRAVVDATRRDPFLAEHPPVVTCNGFQARGYVLDPGSDAEHLLEAVHRATNGTGLPKTTFPGYLDARVFALYDKIPCLVYGAEAQGIHAFDERVSLASLQRVTVTLALFIAAWCGIERSNASPSAP